VTAQFDLGALGWRILLLGGASGVGKSTVAMRLGQRLGVSWLQVDDFRLAFERSGVAIPDSALTPTFDGPRSLIEVGTLLSPAIEVVCENHVAQNNPAILEGDAILPTLFDRPQIRSLIAGGWLRAIFLDEPEGQTIHTNMQARKRGQMDPTHAQKNWRYGAWLCRAATERGVPTVHARPWQTLEDRILIAANSPLMLHAAGPTPHTSGGRP
jgi:2-phosphoglycerate kinase